MSNVTLHEVATREKTDLRCADFINYFEEVVFDSDIFLASPRQISIPPEYTIQITEKLTQEPVQLIGLAARDSLRLEAGMCLYGNDLDETTSPVEAGLSWVIGESP